MIIVLSDPAYFIAQISYEAAETALISQTVISKYNFLCEFQFLQNHICQFSFCLPRILQEREYSQLKISICYLIISFLSPKKISVALGVVLGSIIPEHNAISYMTSTREFFFVLLIFAYLLEERDKRCDIDFKGTARKTFKGTHAHSFVQNLTTWALSLSIEFAYGKGIDTSKFMPLSWLRFAFISNIKQRHSIIVSIPRPRGFKTNR